MTEKKLPGELAGMFEERPGDTSATQLLDADAFGQVTKQRRSGRLTQAIPIVIIGATEDGRVFSEHTRTVVLSLHGAGIVSRHKLMAEQELVLRVARSGNETEVRVVGEIARQGAEYTYGVAFMDQALDFWQLQFPAPAAWRPESLQLECGACNTVVSLTDGDFEFDICAIHGGLARYCKECGMLTVWRQSHDALPNLLAQPESVVPAPEITPPPLGSPEPPGMRQAEVLSLADAMEGTERRSRVRAKVNFFACVRSEEFGEDIVPCIDMSRGGVSFRTTHPYSKGMRIRVAVPFSPEARETPTIFVNGKIAHTSEKDGKWRCGVEFLRT